MKRLLALFLLFLPLMAFSQLKSGKYNIVEHSSIINGESMFEGEKTLGFCFFFIDTDKQTITLLAADYIIAIYNYKTTINHEGSIFYDCTDQKTGQKHGVIYKPHKTIENGGEIMIEQSKTWYDFFTVLIDE